MASVENMRRTRAAPAAARRAARSGSERRRETFAAIAATGDVNIAAIAPGMAAALLATVAGLGVAIPSLFGYNYLGAKAKDIIADMHVFADEFEARVNEYYGA